MARKIIMEDDFRKLVKGNYLYVDKTDFIKEILDQKTTLYTRPRRFGKTLNMSMLY
ncbi:MAG: AAA family ATPase, partial [Erysipelotrichaceae bacterium]